MRIAIAGATGLVGRPLAAAARGAGHEVVELARSRGVDLTTASGLDLTGVEAVVDVTQSPSRRREQATAFFEAVARTLGTAARAAGVRRTVLLSINGIDRSSAANPYHAAKLAHEAATREHAPGVRVLRAAQFHEFAGQMLERGRDGARAEVPDMPLQPVELEAVVEALLAMATGEDERAYVELAGPRRETLAAMVARLDPSVEVVPVPVPEAIAGGALLAGPDATIAGRTFDAWLADGGATVPLEHREFARRARDSRLVDPMPTFEAMSEATGVPVDTLVHHALVRWASAGSEALLSVRPEALDDLVAARRREDWAAVAGIIDWLDAGR